MENTKLKTFVEFLKPDLRNVLLFILFSFICIGGAIQSFAFIDDIPDLPTPPFYDLLKPLNIWSAWVLFSLPIHILGYILKLSWILNLFPDLGAVKFPVTGIVYSYLVSCWMIYTWDKWFKFDNSKSRILIFLIPVILIMINLSPFMLILGLGSVSPLWLLSSLTFQLSVFISYSISVYGILKLIRHSLRKSQRKI